MNCNLVIANNYGDLIDDIKELSTKSMLLLEKGPAYQFDLSLKETRNSYFCVTPKNQALHKSASLFLK